MSEGKTIQIKGEKLTLPKQRSHAKVDIGKALELRIKGNSLQDIANLQGVSKTVIHRALQPYKEHIDRLKTYQNNKADLQDMVASRMLTELLEINLEGQKPNQLATTFDIMAKNHRLETGQSTSNISIKVADLTKYSLEDDN